MRRLFVPFLVGCIVFPLGFLLGRWNGAAPSPTGPKNPKASQSIRSGQSGDPDCRPAFDPLREDEVSEPAKRQERNREPRDIREMLQAIGYLVGYEKASNKRGVTVPDTGRACAGLNLYSTGQKAVLMDMGGTVQHQWQYDFHAAFPNYPKPERHQNTGVWRRVHLLEDGSLLAIYDGTGMIKLDKDSKLIWANPAGFHHDLFVDENGNILTLIREPRVIPKYHKTKQILEDFVVVLDPDGKEISRFSLLAAFEKSPFASMLSETKRHGDILHTNTIEMFDGTLAHRSPLFRKGNLLVSLRNLSAIAIVDPTTRKVVWSLTGQWARQHQPTLLANGNMLLFDNVGHKSRSKVIEFDPFTQEIVWGYYGDHANGFYSYLGGSCQRLTNGNTLITESNAGRAFEVTPENEIVWEYHNPHRVGKDGDVIAMLFEIVRLDPGFPTEWIAG